MSTSKSGRATGGLPHGKPTGYAPACAALVCGVTAASAPTAAAVGEMPDSRVGRLFVDFEDGGHRACSAAVVESANHSVVATAGHCLFPEGLDSVKQPTRWSFAPGYAGGKAPQGEWRGVSVPRVDPGWLRRQETAHDIAFLTLGLKDGKAVQDATGGGLDPSFPAGPPRLDGRGVAVHGYPGLPPYDGNDVVTALGTTSAFEDSAYRIATGITKGASGGPWQDTADGALIGVTSRAAGPDVVGAPFTEATGALLEKAGRVEVR
ncbi:serine protease [Streptomyces sp. ODS05-4]|uniref:trypsin-like serine peptidase n=1 Tax=Streptomyces sp. ODS05-4 TaxID=2944939 RepID=UPI0021086452|nr:trypsin-like peptidase domain-containing protein [Streptomyces sp. ODS05-4]